MDIFIENFATSNVLKRQILTDSIAKEQSALKVGLRNR